MKLLLVILLAIIGAATARPPVVPESTTGETAPKKVTFEEGPHTRTGDSFDDSRSPISMPSSPKYQHNPLMLPLGSILMNPNGNLPVSDSAKQDMWDESKEQLLALLQRKAEELRKSPDKGGPNLPFPKRAKAIYSVDEEIRYLQRLKKGTEAKAKQVNEQEAAAAKQVNEQEAAAAAAKLKGNRKYFKGIFTNPFKSKSDR
jgi:hypothetical protein